MHAPFDFGYFWSFSFKGDQYSLKMANTIIIPSITLTLGRYGTLTLSYSVVQRQITSGIKMPRLFLY